MEKDNFIICLFDKSSIELNLKTRNLSFIGAFAHDLLMIKIRQQMNTTQFLRAVFNLKKQMKINPVTNTILEATKYR